MESKQSWEALAAAIAADLEIAVPSSALPVEPGAASLAQRVLATLYAERAKFENDTHMKNENSYYQHLDAAGVAAVDHWGERLNRWIGVVQLRCASENGGQLSHLHPSQAPHQPMAVAGIDMPASEAQPPAKGKWTERIALAIAIAVLSLLVLAFANIIARYPWLAVLVVLPWVLYMRRGK